MYSELLKSIADMFSNLFQWRTTVSDNKVTNELISDKRDLETACNFAEDAIGFADKYASWQEQRWEERFHKLVKKFRRFR